MLDRVHIRGSNVTQLWVCSCFISSARDSGASANLDDMIIVSGGWDGENILDSVEIINSDELNWQEVDGWRMTEPRYRQLMIRNTTK